MSYVRFGSSNSSVYVFMRRDGLECCGCILQNSKWVEDENAFFGGYLKAIPPIIQTLFDSTQGMIDHLNDHIANGDTVPEYVIPNLLKDDAINFPKD